MVDGGAHTSSMSTVSPSPPDEMMGEEMELPVPEDGMVPLIIPLKNDTEILLIDVRSRFEGQLKTRRGGGTTQPR